VANPARLFPNEGSLIMSSLQVAALGAIAGLTMLLGLRFGRSRRPSVRLKAGLNGVAIGVLIFLEWDIQDYQNWRAQVLVAEAVS
jgi:hypothetical protein